MAIARTGHLSFTEKGEKKSKLSSKVNTSFVLDMCFLEKIKRTYQVLIHRTQFDSQFQGNDALKDMQLVPYMLGSRKGTPKR